MRALNDSQSTNGELRDSLVLIAAPIANRDDHPEAMERF